MSPVVSYRRDLANTESWPNVETTADSWEAMWPGPGHGSQVTWILPWLHLQLAVRDLEKGT